MPLFSNKDTESVVNGIMEKTGVTGNYTKQESAWEFEEFGSQRSGIMGHKYLVVDKTWIRLDVFEIIPYIFTGIIQGRWYNKVVPLFEKHGIEIDYTLRGFSYHRPKPLKERINYRLHKIPKIIKNKLELQKLRKKYE